MYYDSHTHLNNENMYSERQKYMDLFVEVGWKGLVNAGASDFYNQKGIEIAKESVQKYPNLWVKTTIWRHPLECVENIITRENISAHMEQLRNQYLVNKEHIVAIGEIWIDVHFPNGPETIALQKELFAMQCNLAQEFDLPIVVHSRDDFDSTLDILKNYKNQIIYIHCWSYGPEEYKILNNLFPKLFIGFCGNVTYKKAQNLRDTLAIVGDSQLVLETDAPYLSPEWIRGTTNHPANVKLIYDFVAEYKNISLQKLQIQIEKNIQNLYNIK